MLKNTQAHSGHFRGQVAQTLKMGPSTLAQCSYSHAQVAQMLKVGELPEVFCSELPLSSKLSKTFARLKNEGVRPLGLKAPISNFPGLRIRSEVGEATRHHVLSRCRGARQDRFALMAPGTAIQSHDLRM